MSANLIFILLVLVVAAFVAGIFVYRNNIKRFGELDKQIKSLLEKK